MTKKGNSPEIRFEGFSDAWEQRKLGELMNVTSVKGHTILHEEVCHYI